MLNCSGMDAARPTIVGRKYNPGFPFWHPEPQQLPPELAYRGHECAASQAILNLGIKAHRSRCSGEQQNCADTRKVSEVHLGGCEVDLSRSEERRVGKGGRWYLVAYEHISSS